MKKRALYIGLSVASLAVIWSCKTIPINSSNVVNDAFGIVIEPTDFKGDQKCFDNILAKYDTGLYLIKTKRADGKVYVQGTLDDKFTNQTLKDWIEKDFNNKRGFTSSALRVGCWPVHYGPFETPSTRGSGGSAANGCAANAQKRINGPAGGGANPQHQAHLIRELQPLLEKYSKTPTPTPTPHP